MAPIVIPRPAERRQLGVERGTGGWSRQSQAVVDDVETHSATVLQKRMLQLRPVDENNPVVPAQQAGVQPFIHLHPGEPVQARIAMHGGQQGQPPPAAGNGAEENISLVAMGMQQVHILLMGEANNGQGTGNIRPGPHAKALDPDSPRPGFALEVLFPLPFLADAGDDGNTAAFPTAPKPDQEACSRPRRNRHCR